MQEVTGTLVSVGDSHGAILTHDARLQTTANCIYVINCAIMILIVLVMFCLANIEERLIKLNRKLEK